MFIAAVSSDPVERVYGVGDARVVLGGNATSSRLRFRAGPAPKRFDVGIMGLRIETSGFHGISAPNGLSTEIRMDPGPWPLLTGGRGLQSALSPGLSTRATSGEMTRNNVSLSEPCSTVENLDGNHQNVERHNNARTFA